MKLNIGHKIFAVAVVVLILMAIVSVFSLRITSNISNELNLVAKKQLPLSDTIGQINVSILEQGILLQQLFVLPHDTEKSIQRLEGLKDRIERNFDRANHIIENDALADHPDETFDNLKKTLLDVEKEYRQFEVHSIQLLELHDRGDMAQFIDLLPELNKQQAAIDKEISALRVHVENVAETSVSNADEEEYKLLVFHSVMTVIASVLGLGIASMITIVLVKNIRRLVAANEQVEIGQLDIAVPITTHDEVGKLSASFNNMVDGLRTKERIKDTFGKYMDPRIVSRLIDKPDFCNLGGERYEMTVMFIDLKGYTSISEKLSPDELVDMLNLFLGRMTDAVSANHGVVNDFMGDAVMAYWGPPFSGEDDHALLACKAAVDARNNFQLFVQDVHEKLGERAEGLDIDMRVGLSTGEVIAGNIGSSASRKYSLVGDPVNLGSRLEGANKNYGTHIIISERTRELAGETIHVRELDLIRVKGKTEPTRIYELFADEQETTLFDTALRAYRAQDWDGAIKAFEACEIQDPADPVPAIFKGRIDHLKQQPPGADWDCVWDFLTK
ncbi:adenylate/guanylate cyclase domain-containing protein [Terasakiella sp. A23]|uniref:adenylate/guanylate cyclase domain-containing protein n=1 Tax=Terasakiella sp. FCG-A23 TaxID=3080561 RepID=UPI002954FC07|nr:adenylate/guanylate cyclase domain-containing protein [Terasakiella sp. A23]MDV7338045.1 adenylate/guanylate cyclase domain-containing protein [Terasakiella sp. A23]